MSNFIKPERQLNMVKKLQENKIPELVPPIETKPLYNIDNENHIVLSNDETNVVEGRAQEIELLSRFEIIGGHQKNIFKALKHFYIYGCSFAKDLEKSLNMNRGTAHRLIDQLVSAGFIEALTRTHIPAKFGNKTTIYGLVDVTTREVQQAISRDMKYSSRSLRFVDIIYQRTLTDVANDSIQMSKIMSTAKGYGNTSGFHFTDIANFVANKHQLEGVKVWR